MTNLDLLLEMILLVADLQDLKANPSRPAMGTVLEAQLDRGRGPVATVLVRNGTLARGRLLHLSARCSAKCAPCRTIAARRSAKRSLPPRSKCSVSNPCPKPATISRW